MKLSRTAAYAVHVLVYIAANENSRPVIGHVAAKDLTIPEGFLLRILVSMSRAGLLRSVKGPNGGYNLGRPPNGITLLDIVEASEGPVAANAEPTRTPPDAVDKKVQQVWGAATEGVRKELRRVTLADLVADRRKGR